MNEVLSIEDDAAMTAEDFRVYHLGELLRNARARAPVPAHLAGGVTGRIGLTQAQTAEWLVCSLENYRKFEHGRIMHPDPRFLAKVVCILHMSRAEAEILYRLAPKEPQLTPDYRPSRSDVQELQSMLDGMGNTPALITDIAWNLQAWNRAVVENVVDPRQYPEELRNTILWLFTREAADRFPMMPDEYELLVGRIHAAYLASGGRSPVLLRLAKRLLEIPFATAYWKAGALALEPRHQTRLLRDPVLGTGPVHTVGSDLQHGLRMFQFVPDAARNKQSAAQRTPHRSRGTRPAAAW